MSRNTPPTRPNWDRLYETALAQAGHFTTSQAAEAGYSPQLLAKYLANGRIRRIRRAIYRMVHYPAGDHEDLAVHWLWSARAGVFSHETALALQQLSGALPARVFLTLPAQWRGRRLRVPRGLVLHYGAVSSAERRWFGCVPVTAPRRTLADCVRAHIAPELLRDALRDATERGLVRHPVPGVREYLAPYGLHDVGADA